MSRVIKPTGPQAGQVQSLIQQTADGRRIIAIGIVHEHLTITVVESDQRLHVLTVCEFTGDLGDLLW